MKKLLTILVASVLGAGLAFAQCAACGCKTKCSDDCKCKHEKKAS